MSASSEDRFHLFLLPAEGDPPLQSPEFQKELREFGVSLRAEGLTFSQPFFFRNAIEGGGYSTGEFIISTGEFIIKLTPVVAGGVAACLTKVWFGRHKVRVKYGPFKVEAPTLEDAKKVFDSLSRQTSTATVTISPGGGWIRASN